MKKAILGLAVLMTGCAPIKLVTAPEASLNSLKGAPLTTVTFEKTDVTALTAGKAMFGALGGAAMVAAGNGIIKDNEVPDPAHAIAARLSPKVGERLAVSATQATAPQKVNKETEKDLAAHAGGKGVVLDVKTVNWMFAYFPTNWTHYRVTYVARARLVDAGTGKLVAQVPCTYVSDDETTAPTYDQLLENKAALLKTKLETAGNACAEIFEKNLYPAAPVQTATQPQT